MKESNLLQLDPAMTSCSCSSRVQPKSQKWHPGRHGRQYGELMRSAIHYGHAYEPFTLVGAADAQKSSTGTTTGSGSSTTSRLWTYSESLTRPFFEDLLARPRHGYHHDHFRTNMSSNFRLFKPGGAEEKCRLCGRIPNVWREKKELPDVFVNM